MYIWLGFGRCNSSILRQERSRRRTCQSAPVLCQGSTIASSYGLCPLPISTSPLSMSRCWPSQQSSSSLHDADETFVAGALPFRLCLGGSFRSRGSFSCSWPSRRKHCSEDGVHVVREGRGRRRDGSNVGSRKDTAGERRPQWRRRPARERAAISDQMHRQGMLGKGESVKPGSR